MARLTESEISAALTELPDWTRAGDSLMRTIRFPEFMAGIGFLNRIAELAEAADHHPDVDIRYRTLRFALTSHDEGGLTQRDLAMAKQIDGALGSSPHEKVDL